MQVSSIRNSVSGVKNAFVTIPTECSYHIDVSSPNSITELPKRIGINDYPINLADNKQPFYAFPNHPLPLRIFIRKIDGFDCASKV